MIVVDNDVLSYFWIQMDTGRSAHARRARVAARRLAHDRRQAAGGSLPGHSRAVGGFCPAMTICSAVTRRID
jgi:hypothetical protein